MRIRRLILLRHGQTVFNADSRMQGQLDTELTSLGCDQALQAAEVLANRQPLLIVSSDLQRARITAKALADRTGAPLIIDSRLREMHLGVWQGLTESQIDATAPGSRLEWRSDPTWAGHRGESRVDAAARAMPLLNELVAARSDWGIDEPERSVVLAAHNAVIAALSAQLLELPVHHWSTFGGLGNGSWAQLSGHSDHPARAPDAIRWHLDIWNATARLASEVP